MHRFVVELAAVSTDHTVTKYHVIRQHGLRHSYRYLLSS